MPDDRRLDRVEWRLDVISGRVSAVEREVDEIVNEKKIATAVADELAKRDGRLHLGGLPWPAKLGAFAAGALVVADALRGLIVG